MTLNKKGAVKRIEGQTAQKARVVVWQWVSIFREAVPSAPGNDLSLSHSNEYHQQSIAAPSCTVFKIGR